MKTHPDDCAFPNTVDMPAECSGLTKRELFAAVIHSGLVASEAERYDPRKAVERGGNAVGEANALIAALNKETT